MIIKHLDLKWHKLIELKKEQIKEQMKVVFNYIVFSWVCSYLSLKISAIWLADEEGPESAGIWWHIKLKFGRWVRAKLGEWTKPSRQLTDLSSYTTNAKNLSCSANELLLRLRDIEHLKFLCRHKFFDFVKNMLKTSQNRSVDNLED